MPSLRPGIPLRYLFLLILGALGFFVFYRISSVPSVPGKSNLETRPFFPSLRDEDGETRALKQAAQLRVQQEELLELKNMVKNLVESEKRAVQKLEEQQAMLAKLGGGPAQTHQAQPAQRTTAGNDIFPIFLTLLYSNAFIRSRPGRPAFDETTQRYRMLHPLR